MRKKLSLKDYALWLLGAREYSVARLRQKCTEKYPEQLEEIEILINNFVQNKFLDDERFCEVMIRSEIRKGNGKSKILQKLMQKGVSSDLAKTQCDALIENTDLFDPAWTLAEKKKIQIDRKYPDLSDFEKKQKVTQYLAGRGYSFDLIKEVLD
ncbi:regulatory protein RecX [Candidatus Peregrinibacteria bacterium]|nr:regulatory protein RecX [bacterium]NCQ56105.1 regulatory protein RecX [Candidatus Parcubacteria bacterium]NCS67923.1 regulatory protein RecX [Candidatus Peregrinibacteria bacterium]